MKVRGARVSPVRNLGGKNGDLLFPLFLSVLSSSFLLFVRGKAPIFMTVLILGVCPFSRARPTFLQRRLRREDPANIRERGKTNDVLLSPLGKLGNGRGAPAVRRDECLRPIS